MYFYVFISYELFKKHILQCKEIRNNELLPIADSYGMEESQVPRTLFEARKGGRVRHIQTKYSA